MSSIYVGIVTPGRIGEFVKAFYLKSNKGISISKGISSVLIVIDFINQNYQIG